MSKQQLQADINESIEENEFQENLTTEEGKLVDEQWEKTLHSEKSIDMLNKLISSGLEEAKEFLKK